MMEDLDIVALINIELFLVLEPRIDVALVVDLGSGRLAWCGCKPDRSTARQVWDTLPVILGP